MTKKKKEEEEEEEEEEDILYVLKKKVIAVHCPPSKSKSKKKKVKKKKVKKKKRTNKQTNKQTTRERERERERENIMKQNTGNDLENESAKLSEINVTEHHSNICTTEEVVLCCCFPFVAAVILILPIIELVMYSTYKYEISNCSSELMSIDSWIIIDGINGLMLGSMFLSLMICGMYELEVFAQFATFFVYIFSLFSFSWLIIGSVLFWRDCPSLEPKPMNDLMYAVLILGYIGVFVRLQSEKKRE